MLKKEPLKAEIDPRNFWTKSAGGWLAVELRGQEKI
jgi:hypothetical protein